MTALEKIKGIENTYRFDIGPQSVTDLGWVRWGDDKGNSGVTENIGGFGALTEKNCMGVGIRVVGNVYENPDLLKPGTVCQ